VHRKLMTHAAVFAVGLAAGIDTVVKQLRSVNRKLNVLNRTVGGSKTKAPKTSAWTLLQDICESTGSYSGCGKPLP
jgi:hypothetical protein